MGCTASLPSEHEPCVSTVSSITESQTNADGAPSPTGTDRKHKTDYDTILSSPGQLAIPPKFKKWFPPRHGHTRIRDLFEWHGEVGHGVTGSVHKVTYKSQICAVKQIEKNDQWGRMLFETEAQVLSKLSHSSIIRFIDMFFDEKYYYLVLEKADFDLYYVMKKKGHLSERKTRNIVYALLQALSYMHRKNLAHRDLKPENIVFLSSDTNHPRLIDFGDAEMARKDREYTEFVGTPPYMAPERLDRHYGWQLKKADIWAIAVIAYEMYCGRRCFRGETQKEVFRRILRGEWSWPRDRIPSDDFKDFIERCLQQDANDRPSAQQALHHTWFDIKRKEEEKTQKEQQLQDTAMDSERYEQPITHEELTTQMVKLKDITEIPIFENLANMVQSNPLQDILVKGYVETTKGDDLTPYQQQFDTLDTDKDGCITGPDLVSAFTANGIGPNQASSLASILLSLLDRHRKGKITFKQFLEARFKYDLSNRPREVFDSIVAASHSNLLGAHVLQAGFDTDGTRSDVSSRSPSLRSRMTDDEDPEEEEEDKENYIPRAGKGISKNDIIIFSKSHSNLNVDRQELREIFCKYDKDGDGKLTYDDFAEAMQSTTVAETAVHVPTECAKDCMQSRC